jgi:hypothetical protein
MTAPRRQEAPVQLISFPQRHRPVEPPRPQLLGGEARISGGFTAPSGRAGTATGWFRLARLHVAGDRLSASGVVTADLVDADGTEVGVGSRRLTVPADVDRSSPGAAVLIGPVDVDLLGLSVRVQAFAVQARRVPVARRRPDRTSWADDPGGGTR